MHRFLTFLLILCFQLKLLAQNQATENLTLQSALKIALENNYRIKLADERKSIANNNVTPGNAGMLPTITTGTNFTRSLSNIRQEFSDGGRAPIVSNGARVENLNANITLNWVLFDGFRMFANNSRLKLLQQNSADALQAAIQNTVASVSSAYYNIIQQQNKERVLQEAVKLGEERLNLAKNKYEVGSGSKLEYFNAQVDLNTDKSNLLRQQALTKQAQIDLNLALARNPKTDFRITDTILVKNTLNEPEFLNSALQQNISLLLAKRNQELAYQDLKAIRSILYPQVALVSGYQINDTRNGAGLFKRNYSGNLQGGVTASWTLYNGNNNNRLIQNQKITESINKLRTDSLKLEIEGSLYQQFVIYNNALQLVELEVANQTIAKQNVSIANDRYKIGVATPLEFREAQRNLIATQSRLIEAYFQAKVAEIEIYRISNKPFPFMNAN
jgi:outer membrane protein